MNKINAVAVSTDNMSPDKSPGRITEFQRFQRYFLAGR